MSRSMKKALPAGVGRWVERASGLFALEGIGSRLYSLALVFSLMAAGYWLIIASDRYVSEAHIIIQRTDLAAGQVVDFSNLLGGSMGSSADQLLLRDHLLSIDMLLALDAKLDLRNHYSNWRRDPLSRIWSATAPIERFHGYFQSRVSVDFDEYTGILVIKAQAYDPDTAHAIASLMVAEGERHMNTMAHDLADEQVRFLERQVAEMNDRAMRSRQLLIAFQNENSLASPQNAAQTLESIIGSLEAQLTELHTRKTAMLGYLMPGSPGVRELELQIAATEKQIKREQKRLASPEGNTLNSAIEAFQRLEMEAAFAQDVYKTSLVALEKGRIEATRTLKKVSILQSPSMPEAAVQPRRIYNTIVFLLLSLMVAGVLNLVAVIIRDHRD